MKSVRRMEQNHCLIGFLLVVILLCPAEGQTLKDSRLGELCAQSLSLSQASAWIVPLGTRGTISLRQGLFLVLLATFESLCQSQDLKLKQLTYCHCYYHFIFVAIFIIQGTTSPQMPAQG